jgi:hypothetical protein
MQLRKNHPVYRFVNWVRQEPWEGTNLCPFFWTFIFCILVSPGRVLASGIYAVEAKVARPGALLTEYPADYEANKTRYGYQKNTFRFGFLRDLAIVAGLSLVGFLVLGLIITLIVGAVADPVGFMAFIPLLVGIPALSFALKVIGESDFNLKNSVIYQFVMAKYKRVCPSLTLID